MSIRTIEAPGVEITEIDKSGYSTNSTGTHVFVMGYAPKGEPYIPQQFSSKSAFQQYYGEPTNEAERYFYNACIEVINQNGVLYSARIPYDNDSNNKMVAFKYNVSTYVHSNPTAGEYISGDTTVGNIVKHSSSFKKDAVSFAITNKTYREIDADEDDGIEQDTEIRDFYLKAIDRFDKTYGQDLQNQRYSISYLSVDEKASAGLSARFLTRNEAIDYLKIQQDNYVPGKYETIVKDYNDNYNIISDGGDWIAVPLYCNFIKETTTVSAFTAAAKPENETISDLVDYCKTTFDINDDIGDLDDLKSKLQDKLNDLSIEGQDYSNISSIINTLEKYSDLGSSKVNEEIGFYGYLHQRIKDLKALSTSNLTIPDVYDKHYLECNCGTLIDNFDKTYSFITNSCYKVSSYQDGLDMSYLVDTTVSSLYYDSRLKLSDDSDLKRMIETNQELWRDYFENGNLLCVVHYEYEDDNGKKIETQIDSWDGIISTFEKFGGITYSDLYTRYGITNEQVNEDVPFYNLLDLDQSLKNYITISPTEQPIAIDLSSVDSYLNNEDAVPANSFYVVDKTCSQLKSIVEDERKGEQRQLIGIFPVITTVANALVAQKYITPNTVETLAYETVSGITTKDNGLTGDDHVDGKSGFIANRDLTLRFSQADRTQEEIDAGDIIETVSLQAAEFFPPIHMLPELDGIQKEHSKKIGVVVYQAYLDSSEGNKVSFNPVESYVGSLDKNAKDPNTNTSQFIDDIINNNSDYIYFFSNMTEYGRKAIDQYADFLTCKRGPTGMLGFYEHEKKSLISLTSLYTGIDQCFSNVQDINDRDIDLIPDAGLANIAQYIRSIYGSEGAHEYDLDATDDVGNPLIKKWKANSAGAVEAWKYVLGLYDTFCKKTRKDCMFIADGPRPFCLQGNKKIIRSSKPTNTIDSDILPNVKYMTGVNTNYGAGYCDWFLITDEFTGDTFWCPPSIKACGVYINTDLNYEYWDAPAGLNRGVITALDCAFSPTIKQAGTIYSKNWNYAINYSTDGIVLEGQKTLQTNASAFDRVNARRLFLRLERQAYKIARYFVYEGNTEYTRQRLVDALDPMLLDAKVGGGIYDYKIVCDETINTDEVIDNNELRVKIGIKPTKTAEFVLLDFVALTTGGDFSEM